jgi:hypothetical protein
VSEYKYMPCGWLDVYVSEDARVMITRHPRHDRGEYVVTIDGERVCQRDSLALAKWKAHNLLEGKA